MTSGDEPTKRRRRWFAKPEPVDEWARFATELGDPTELERRFRSLAMLYAILGGHNGYYFYEQRFMGSDYRLGEYQEPTGNHAFMFFGADGAFLRSFDHEDPMSPYRKDELWPGLLAGLPSQFEKFVSIPHKGDEPEYPAITVALWHSGAGWQHGELGNTEHGWKPDPAVWMFHLLVSDFTLETVQADLEEFSETDLDAATIAHFLALGPLTRERVLALNPGPDWEAITTLAGAAGYPSDL